MGISVQSVYGWAEGSIPKAERIERFFDAGSGVEVVSKPGEGTCVTLKLVGLFALMAQSGLFLPAGARVHYLFRLGDGHRGGGSRLGNGRGCYGSCGGDGDLRDGGRGGQSGGHFHHFRGVLEPGAAHPHPADDEKMEEKEDDEPAHDGAAGSVVFKFGDTGTVPAEFGAKYGTQLALRTRASGRIVIGVFGRFHDDGFGGMVRRGEIGHSRRREKPVPAGRSR
ncbi:MAG: hypothetical protein EGQ81_05905 [Akkermansia sp.]|nr:hypothetical protein [Akkermansia sp.]